MFLAHCYAILQNVEQFLVVGMDFLQTIEFTEKLLKRGVTLL